MKFRLETLNIDGDDCACLVGEDEKGIVSAACFRFKELPERTLRLPEPPKIETKPIANWWWMTAVLVCAGVVLFGPHLVRMFL